MRSKHWMRPLLLLPGLLLATACSGGTEERAERPATPAAEPRASAPAPATTPAAAGEVIEVRMKDAGGKYLFEPSRIEAKRGDVIRFIQDGTMPHNVEFTRGKVPAGVDLGELWSGRYLTTPGETYEVTVDSRFKDGTYPYVCLPHATMGMTGEITVAGER